jgi:hypothetical protein
MNAGSTLAQAQQALSDVKEELGAVMAALPGCGLFR